MFLEKSKKKKKKNKNPVMFYHIMLEGPLNTLL